ncbi:MAG: response regulator SirA [Elusimicrobia bacterium]|nr:response regulator SirA [Elusimicrobiota bacterium]
MVENQLTLFPLHKSSYKITQVIKRNGQIVAFDKEKITNAIFKAAVQVEGKDRELAVLLANQVIRKINKTYIDHTIPTVEEIQDLIEKVLIENGHARTAKAFILYRAERSRIREKKELTVAAEDTIPYKLVWKVYSWNVDHACDSVEKLNALMENGLWKKLVSDSEKHYQEQIQRVAETLKKKIGQIKLMIVAGPSSSGKTTTTFKISESLKSKGISFVLMNLDNYFKSLEAHPKDQYGDYDFERPDALDIALINEDLNKLLKGKKIKMPLYDFKTGKRVGFSQELYLKKGEIILIDSLHGLHEKLTQVVPKEQKFKFYIEAICQIKDKDGNFVRWTDLRLLRRMIRDSWQRGCDATRTVGHWHYVRRSEKRYIVPFISNADIVFNGSIPYELPVYKSMIEKKFPEIIEKYRKEPHKMDAFIRSQRVYKLLKSLKAFPETDFIPKNSILREFIGGGIYNY